jgi:hypothetical protein
MREPLQQLILSWPKHLYPDIESLLGKIGLRQYVNIYYEPSSYLWRLMKLIEENPMPIYDMCYIDGVILGIQTGLRSFLLIVF